MNRTFYTCLFYIALPLIVLRLWWRGRKAPDYRHRIAERFAFDLPDFQKNGIWVHAVSVGETIAATPMIEALLRQYPQWPLTVTCMTPTGSERIRSIFGDRVQHSYLPYDIPDAMGRFLQALQPRLAIVMETEVWPNLVHSCCQRGIPVMLANARLSERSARGYARFPRLIRPTFAALSWIAVQTEAEAERFRRLGADGDRTSVIGSIKFDLQIAPSTLAQAAALRRHWQADHRPVWIGASTHAGEDQTLLAAHRRLLEEFPNALLILVPRHPERFDEVDTACRKAGFVTVRRSLKQSPGPECQVFLGDTMGELLLFYALADVAFVGGSLVPRGGHNVLEPAALGKPVITGPSRFNFQEIANQLENENALTEVQDVEGLVNAVSLFWTDPVAYSKSAEAGLQVLKRNQGALQRLLSGIDRLLS